MSMETHNDIKHCPRCNQDKPRENFSPSTQTVDGLQGHCKECRKTTSKLSYKKRRKYYKKWRLEHKEEKRSYDLIDGPKRRLKLKTEVIKAYGGSCDCCEETTMDFLAIDHIECNGAQERRKKGMGSGRQTYLYLKRRGYPSGYRVLCHNCNFSSFQHNGICVHKLNSNSIVT